jgi:TPR repeat protein
MGTTVRSTGYMVLHRPVEPALDFGIVAIKESSSTQSTRYLLTPAQGSPEQWKGMKSSALDGRADLYALGVVWYEMLTGRLPLHAHTNEGWMRAHLDEIPEPPSRFNPELAQHPKLDALVLKLLAKDREQRPHDAQAFLGELNLVEAQLSWNDAPTATPVTSGEATAMFGSHAKELAFQTPSPFQQGPLPPPSFEASLIARTATYKETSILEDASTESPIARVPAASVEASPMRSGFRTALILIACAVVASLVVLGVTYDSRIKPANSAALLGSTQQACDRGGSVSCFALGESFEHGWGVAEDFNIAMQFYQKACDGSDGQGCLALGGLYKSGLAVAEDGNRAAELFQKACDLGDGKGCAYVKKGEDAAREEKAASAQTSAAKPPVIVQLTPQPPIFSRTGKSMEIIGGSTNNGAQERQASQNATIAVASPQPNPPATPPTTPPAAPLAAPSINPPTNPPVSLPATVPVTPPATPPVSTSSTSPLTPPARPAGELYKRGTLLEANEILTEAANSYQASCDGGDAGGCRKLGDMYFIGRGVASDESRAVQLYQKGCEGGDAEGCTSLGTMYDSGGQGVAMDESKAVQLLQKGCDGGVAKGCRFLGFKYLHGWGVAKDKNRAAQLFRKGCELGDALGCANLKIK